MFWEKLLSDNFEIDYKVALLEALRANSKGNPQTLVNGYMSHARKFRNFLSETELEQSEQSRAKQTKEIEDVIPTPSVEEVEFYLKQWDALENYHLQEDALDKLFSSCVRKTKKCRTFY